jgi:hypothetical protein
MGRDTSAVVASMREGGGAEDTDWEGARGADVGEGGLHVGDGECFGAVPVYEAVADGESFVSELVTW